MTKARATGDPSLYARADRVLSGALRRDPGNVAALVGAGTLAGLRHDFREQLRLGLAAKRVAPALARPYTVIADAQIELGQYGEAARSIQTARGPQARPSRLRARVLLPRTQR